VDRGGKRRRRERGKRREAEGCRRGMFKIQTGKAGGSFNIPILPSHDRDGYYVAVPIVVPRNINIFNVNNGVAAPSIDFNLHRYFL
jgi:hypothetical protein